jgi:CheY-like chemotaxis protein
VPDQNQTAHLTFSAREIEVRCAVSAEKVVRHPAARSNLLVVEDDADTRCRVADALRAEGFKVLEASSGEDALEVLQAMPVHLVFAEIHLPGPVGGLAVARLALTCPLPPKIILTGDATAEAAIPDLDGFGPFIPKPYSAADVVDIVRRALDPTQ